MKTEKTCTKCNVTKALSCFGKRKDSKDGYAFRCKDCERERLRNRRSTISYEEAILKGLEKKCTQCKCLKKISEFNQNKRGRLGSTSICKECEKERQKVTRSTISYEEAVELNLTKVCRVCKVEKSVKQYYRDCKSKFGVINVCKECDSTIKKQSKSLISYEEAVSLELTKICSKCKVEKLVKEFHKANRGKYGVGSWCKGCRRIYKREHYLKNAERIIQEKKEYYYKNREILNAKKKIYRTNNQEKLKRIHREYRQNNKDICRKHCQVRRARKRELKADFTVEEWLNVLEFFDYKCAYCRTEPKNNVSLQQEHVKPVSEGGDYTANNIVPACKKCNSSKGAKEMRRWFREQEFYDNKNEENILKYLKMVDGEKYK